MNVYHIDLAVSPVSSAECESVIHAFRTTWQPAAMIRRLPHGEAWLLSFSHEGELRPEETSRWFAERLAAAIWHALGRYARITLDLHPIQASTSIEHLLFDENDYLRISRDFRLSHPARK